MIATFPTFLVAGRWAMMRVPVARRMQRVTDRYQSTQHESAQESDVGVALVGLAVVLASKVAEFLKAPAKSVGVGRFEIANDARDAREVSRRRQDRRVGG